MDKSQKTEHRSDNRTAFLEESCQDRGYHSSQRVGSINNLSMAHIQIGDQTQGVVLRNIQNTEESRTRYEKRGKMMTSSIIPSPKGDDIIINSTQRTGNSLLSSNRKMEGKFITGKI